MSYCHDISIFSQGLLKYTSALYQKGGKNMNLLKNHCRSGFLREIALNMMHDPGISGAL